MATLPGMVGDANDEVVLKITYVSRRETPQVVYCESTAQANQRIADLKQKADLIDSISIFRCMDVQKRRVTWEHEAPVRPVPNSRSISCVK